MPYCPNCNAEYREGFTVCSDCNADLVEEKPVIKEEKAQYDKEAYLLSVADDMEASVVSSLLEAHDIPVYKRHREAGAYLSIYMGQSKFGIDIFVPESFLEEAREITQGYHEEDNNEELYEEGDRYKRNARIRSWVILMFFIPGIVVAVLMIIIHLLKI
jgi:hypothetical protein